MNHLALSAALRHHSRSDGLDAAGAARGVGLHQSAPGPGRTGGRDAPEHGMLWCVYTSASLYTSQLDGRRPLLGRQWETRNAVSHRQRSETTLLPRVFYRRYLRAGKFLFGGQTSVKGTFDGQRGSSMVSLMDLWHIETDGTFTLVKPTLGIGNLGDLQAWPVRTHPCGSRPVIAVLSTSIYNSAYTLIIALYMIPCSP